MARALMLVVVSLCIAAGVSLGTGLAGTETTGTSTGGRSAPGWLTGPGVTGAPVQGQTLTAGNGAWTNSPVSYTYQWRRCNPTCSNVSSATNSTYTLDAADVGATVDVVTTAHNSSGNTSHTSAPTARISSTFSTARPRVTSERTIVSHLTQPSTGAGNDHDPQLLGLEHALDGNLFATYVDGSSSTDLTYGLMKSTNAGLTWSTVDRTHDAGPNPARVLVDSTNRVYTAIWNSGTNGVCLPRIADYGIDAARGTNPTFMRVPGSWANGISRGDCIPYEGNAIDSSGNLYMIEDFDASLGGNALQTCSTASTHEDGCYLGELAWTTGGHGNFTWHFAVLPTVAGANGGADTFRYGYSFLMPDNNGGLDIVSTNDPACKNTSFTGNTAISSPAYTTESSSDSRTAFMQDRVYDWHTDALNAPGGPAWTVSPVSTFTRSNGGQDCPSTVRGLTLIQNNYAQDAYRDIYGRVHVMYTVCRFSSGPPCAPAQSYEGHHAVLNGNGSVRTDVQIKRGYCDNTARINQDYTGRFYIYSVCGAGHLYTWAGDTRDGTSINSSRSPTATLAINTSPDTWLFFGRAGGGTAVGQKYADVMYPVRSGRALDYVRIKLAR